MSSSEEHQEILNEIRKVRVDLVRHVEDDHDFIYRTDVENILNAQTRILEQMAEQQEIIAVVVLGEKKTTYDGEAYREGGIKDIVDNFRDTGVLKFEIPWAKLLTLIGTVIAAVAAIVVAIIETIGG